MHVTLPSGHTAEFRDVFLRGDRREAEKGIVVVISPDGTRRMEGSVASAIATRVIRQMLVGWDFDQGSFPLPSQCSTEELKEAALDRLDDDDYDALAKAVGPWVEKVLNVDRGAVFAHQPSGIRVTPVNAADAAKLDALAEFEREGGTDPKSGSKAIETSS